MSICKSVGKFDHVPPAPAAPSVTLDQGHRLSRTPRSFWRAARVFLSALVDNSPFQEVSLRREASILFTSNGPLVYRWEADATNRKARVAEVHQLFISSSIKPTPRIGWTEPPTEPGDNRVLRSHIRPPDGQPVGLEDSAEKRQL
jgi:hypothetical protein